MPKKIILAGIIFTSIYPCISKAELSSDILKIKIEMRNTRYEQLQNCGQELRKYCNIKLALNNMHPNNRLQNKPGDIDYEKAEQYLTSITGESIVARMLLGEIKMHQGKRKEALALISSSGTEGFPPALDNLTISSALVYAGQTDEFSELRSLKWQYKYYEQQKDPDIAYQIAAHFITPPYKDCNAAKLWFARATEGHNANINAQQLLGEQYETGDCMPQDYIMAYMMYDLGGTATSEKNTRSQKKCRLSKLVKEPFVHINGRMKIIHTELAMVVVRLFIGTCTLQITDSRRSLCWSCHNGGSLMLAKLHAFYSVVQQNSPLSFHSGAKCHSPIHLNYIKKYVFNTRCLYVPCAAHRQNQYG